METPSRSRRGAVRIPKYLFEDQPEWLKSFISELKYDKPREAIGPGGYQGDAVLIGEHPSFDEVEASETLNYYAVGPTEDGYQVIRENK